MRIVSLVAEHTMRVGEYTLSRDKGTLTLAHTRFVHSGSHTVFGVFIRQPTQHTQTTRVVFVNTSLCSTAALPCLVCFDGILSTIRLPMAKE